MLRTIEIIKEQIKAIQYDQQGEKKSEVQELQELVEFINYDREILLSENQRLTRMIEENPWKGKCIVLQEELERERNKNAELYRRVEDLEEMIAGLSFNKSCMESGCFTDRPGSARRGGEKGQDYLVSSFNERNRNIKHSSTLGNRSPEKPPRAIDRNSKVINKLPNKATVEIKNNLSKAIEEAHKTLFHTFQNKTRSISPGLSTGSSRYSTPPRRLNLNASVMSNN